VRKPRHIDQCRDRDLLGSVGCENNDTVIVGRESLGLIPVRKPGVSPGAKASGGLAVAGGSVREV